MATTHTCQQGHVTAAGTGREHQPPKSGGVPHPRVRRPTADGAGVTVEAGLHRLCLGAVEGCGTIRSAALQRRHRVAGSVDRQQARHGTRTAGGQDGKGHRHDRGEGPRQGTGRRDGHVRAVRQPGGEHPAGIQAHPGAQVTDDRGYERHVVRPDGGPAREVPPAVRAVRGDNDIARRGADLRQMGVALQRGRVLSEGVKGKDERQCSGMGVDGGNRQLVCTGVRPDPDRLLARPGRDGPGGHASTRRGRRRCRRWWPGGAGSTAGSTGGSTGGTRRLPHPGLRAGIVATEVEDQPYDDQNGPGRRGYRNPARVAVATGDRSTGRAAVTRRHCHSGPTRQPPAARTLRRCRVPSYRAQSPQFRAGVADGRTPAPGPVRWPARTPPGSG